MSEKFEASRGGVVVKHDSGDLMFDCYGSDGCPAHHLDIGIGAVQALREFFLHERDQKLGRWRWVDTNGDQYLVLKLNYNDGFRVTRESSMETLDWIPSEYQGAAFAGLGMVRAIRAYLDAHPEPKPWHDAKPGEVWVLTDGLLDRELACVRSTSGFRRVSRKNVFLDESRITAGRRIWPEVSDDCAV